MVRKLEQVPLPEKIEQVLRTFGIEEVHPLQVELLRLFFEKGWLNEDGLVVYMFSKRKSKFRKHRSEFYLAKGEPYWKRRLLLHTVTILEKFKVIEVRRMRDPLTKRYRKYLFMPLEVLQKFIS